MNNPPGMFVAMMSICAVLIPPTGIELLANLLGKNNKRVRGGNAGGNIPSDSTELLKLFEQLPLGVKAKYLAEIWPMCRLSASVRKVEA